MKLFNIFSNKIEELKSDQHVIRIYLRVLFIQNFNDIDDKIINKAEIQKTNYQSISKKYIERYFQDFDSLNVLRATSYPKATEHLNDIIIFIDKLKKKDKA